MLEMPELEVNAQLERCPFCGGRAILLIRLDDNTFEEVGSEINCVDCNISFSHLEATCIEDNIKAWNRRFYE